MSIYSSLSPSVAQEELISPFTESEKIEQFNKLVEVLNRLKPFQASTSQRPSPLPTLAFFVETMTFIYEKDWIVHLQLTIGKLEEFQRVFPDSSEAYRNSTKLLNKLIASLYNTIITVQILELQNDDPEKNKNTISQLFSCKQSYERKEKIVQTFQSTTKRELPIPIINIADQFFPTWYIKIDELEASTYQS